MAPPWFPVIVGFLTSLAPSGVLKVISLIPARNKGPSVRERLLQLASHLPNDTPTADKPRGGATVAAPLNPGSQAEAVPEPPLVRPEAHT